MNKIKRLCRVRAFTLPELMIVLVIIGILVLLALPRLMPLISRAKSTEAQIQLGFLHGLQENYFFLHSTYTLSLESIGFEQSPLISEGGSANYKIEIVEASSEHFIARATAIVDFDRDGQYNIWEIDQNKKIVEIIPD